MAIPYLPLLYHQLDGSAFAQSNCVLATGTALMDRHSVGFWRVPAPTLRVITGDTSGGVTYDQLIPAVNTATKGDVILTPAYAITPAQFKDLVVSGRACGISIDCSVTIDTPFHTASYTGGHTVGVHRWRNYTWTDTAGTHSQEQYLVGDPGRFFGQTPTATDWRWWPASLLYKAALARGGGVIFAVSTRDTEGVSRLARFNGLIYSAATTTATHVGTIVAGSSYSVINTTNGGNWDVANHAGSGWNKIGSGFVVGSNLK